MLLEKIFVTSCMRSLWVSKERGVVRGKTRLTKLQSINVLS